MDRVFSIEGSRVWVAGHSGLAGSALVRRLKSESCTVLTVSHSQLDLRSGPDVTAWMEKNRPDIILLAAAKVGGIKANADYPADFIADNLAIALNVVTQAARQKTRKLLFLGSSCIYPKFATQPIREDALLSGPLEETNEAYAIAKIAGVKLCQFYRRQYGHDFITLMPCNLYGPGDRWGDSGAHVIPALIDRIHLAMVNGAPDVDIWGSGKALREFLYCDDLADACIHMLKTYSGELPVNIGSGEEVPVAELARMIAETVGFQGKLRFDQSLPEGTPRKLLDCTRLRESGWTPRFTLREGLALAYQDYLGASSSRQSCCMKA